MTADTTTSDAGRSLASHPVAIAGVWLTTLAAFAFLTYVALDWSGLVASPYAGIFGFVLLPLVFVCGLLLIPLGVWIERRRRGRGQPASQWPAIDLSKPRTRHIVLAVFGLTVVNLAIVTVASVSAAHYMETNRFCGLVCHTPMEPQFTAHMRSPHAQVDCVQCHVGPGVAGAVQAKMNGTRQLWGVITGHYARPIPSPRERMPVPAQTCNGCHSAIEPDRTITKVYRDRKDNETSSELVTTMAVFAGKAHWHARPDVVVEYVATDNTLKTIPYVRATEAGVTTEFLAEETTAPPAGQPLRRMDCLDCHNRPAHTLSATPGQVVDRAINSGEVSTTVPFVRSEMVEALAAEYPAGTDATAAIVERLKKVFGEATPESRQAVQVAERLYRQNVFPRMNITWGTYVNQIRHTDDTGCFRCHDDLHAAKNNAETKISQECELCHKEE